MLIAIIAILVTIYMLYKVWAEYHDEVFVAICLSVGALLVGAALWFIATVILGSALPKQPVYEKVQLQNINDKTAGQGAFFLGIGGFSEEGKFFYYIKQHGYSKFQNIEAEYAEIHEGSKDAYAMVRTDCKGNWEWLAECVYWSDYVKFYVPSNTIKTNYQLDAQ